MWVLAIAAFVANAVPLAGRRRRTLGDHVAGTTLARAGAYQQAVQDRQKEPDRVYSIVLMSDGENNSGIAPDDFYSYYKNTSGVQDIRTFTILFGEADQKTMQDIASATSGQMFDASRVPLAQIFKEIRGYQ